MLTRSEASLPRYHRTLPQHPQLVWDGPRSEEQWPDQFEYFSSRNEDWYGGSRECGHIGCDVVVCLVAVARGSPCPQVPGVTVMAIAGFGGSCRQRSLISPRGRRQVEGVRM